MNSKQVGSTSGGSKPTGAADPNKQSNNRNSDASVGINNKESVAHDDDGEEDDEEDESPYFKSGDAASYDDLGSDDDDDEEEEEEEEGEGHVVADIDDGSSGAAAAQVASSSESRPEASTENAATTATAAAAAAVNSPVNVDGTQPRRRRRRKVKPEKSSNNNSNNNNSNMVMEREDSDEDGAGGEAVNFDSEEFNQPALAKALPALRIFFLDRLAAVLVSLQENAAREADVSAASTAAAANYATAGTASAAATSETDAAEASAPVATAAAAVREFLAGWHVQVFKRAGGLTQGQLETAFFSADGKKYKSRVDVAAAMGLLPSSKNLRSLTAQQYYLIAMENRERFMVSQQLGLHNYTCEAVAFVDGVITVTPSVTSPLVKTEPALGNSMNETSVERMKLEHAQAVVDTASTTPLANADAAVVATATISSGSSDKDSVAVEEKAEDGKYFTMGNITVLQWGCICPHSPGFHTQSQLYPLGFSCLRQEHDVALDRVVDCFCEIDALYDGAAGISYLNFMRDSTTAAAVSGYSIGEKKTVEAYVEYNYSVAMKNYHRALEAHAASGNALTATSPAAATTAVADVATAAALSAQHALPLHLREPTRRHITPLFRITVQWQLQSGMKTTSRVYEARTPQQAWQAAMLEDVGIRDPSQLCVRISSHDGAHSVLTTAVTDSEEEDDSTTAATAAAAAEFEVPDEEENALRAQIREQRRTFFRLLRTEQSQSTQTVAATATATAATIVRPRLALDASESFADEMLLRMFEGMDGAQHCANYYFIDSREKEAGKRYALKCYSKILNKVKNLDRVIRKNRFFADQQMQHEVKRKRAENMENQKEARKKAKLAGVKAKQSLLAAQKHRIKKLKDMEKAILQLKVAMAKNVKRRREDAKLYAESLAENEEYASAQLALSSANATANSTAAAATVASASAAAAAAVAVGEPDPATLSARPVPAQGSVLFNSDVFEQLLFVWEYLHTFQQSEGGHLSGWTDGAIPSVQCLLRALRACDPAYRSIRSYTMSLQRNFDCLSSLLREAEAATAADVRISHPLKLPAFVDPTPEDANVLLNELGTRLTSILFPDFERAFGLDAVEQLIGDVHVPVNELTWREIARVVLTATAAKDLGATDGDVTALLKDKGFVTTPEPADRKALKLTKRRMRHLYAVCSEVQESVHGFSTGTCVRLPAPNSQYPEHGVWWSELVGSLRQIPDSEGWIIYEVIKAAALSTCVFDLSNVPRNLQRSLLNCLQNPSVTSTDGRVAKQRALEILSNDLRLKMIQQQNGKSSSVAVAAAADDDVSAGAVATVANNAAAAAGIESMADALFQRIRLVYDYTAVTPPLSTFDLWCKQLRGAIRHAYVNEDNVNAGSEFIELDDEAAPSESASSAAAAAAADEEIAAAGEESLRASQLSIAMQRCFLVIRDLMMHPLALPFAHPVDRSTLPDYYNFTSQPLSFSEIRDFLTEGGYNDSIFKFYSDVTLCLENAKAYNNEGSVIKQSAHKLTAVFERLFYEVVLNYENPLMFHDCCHECRSAEPIRVNKAAVCERCEGCYHLHCTDPPMTQPPRSEWYCPGCVEERGVSMVHPFNTAHVRHPDDERCIGEVVGMEQLRQTVVFVVEFGNSNNSSSNSSGGGRELWSGRQIRAQFVEQPLKAEDFINDALFARRAGGAAGSLNLAFTGSSSRQEMPSGYDFDDFDKVCGVAQGYCGWGASQYLVPALMMNEHSKLAQQRCMKDSQFSDYRKAITALGLTAAVRSDEMSAEEWASVLHCLAQRTLNTTPMYNALQHNDALVNSSFTNTLRAEIDEKTLTIERLMELAEKHPDERDGEEEGDEEEDNYDEEDAYTAAVAAVAAGDSRLSPSVDGNNSDDGAASSGARKKSRTAAAAVAKRKKGVNQLDSDEEAEFDGDSDSGNDAGAAEQDDEDDRDGDEDAEEIDNAMLESDDDNSANVNIRRPMKKSKSSSSLTDGVTDASDAGTPRTSDVVAATAAAAAAGDSSAGKKKSVESDAEWELRLLTRMKGREDALLTHLLVWDTLCKADVDCAAEQADAVFQQLATSEELGGPFFELAAMIIVNACMVRPSESLPTREWLKGWDLTMQSLGSHFKATCALTNNGSNSSSNNRNSSGEGEAMAVEDATTDSVVTAAEVSPAAATAPFVLCAVCGCDEISLSSPMVWGQSREEFELDRRSGTVPEVNTMAVELGTIPLAVNIASAAGMKMAKARTRYMDEFLWQPLDSAVAALEAEECELHKKRQFKGGSLPMHECCATFSLFYRQTKLELAKRKEDARILEILSGVFRGKSTTLGTDRDSSCYWLLRGSKALFVRSSSDAAAAALNRPDLSTATAAVAIAIDDAEQATVDKLPLLSSVPPSHRVLNGDVLDAEAAAASTQWAVYESEDDIGRLACWLDPRFERERLLLAVLELLYPNSYAMRGQKKQSSSDSMDASSAVEEIDNVAVGVEEDEVADDAAADEEEVAAAAEYSDEDDDDINDVDEDAADEDDDEDEAMTAALTRADSTAVAVRSSERRRVPSKIQSSISDFYANGSNSNSGNGIGSSSDKGSSSSSSSNTAATSSSATAAKRSHHVHGARFRKGDHVLVDASARNNMLWGGRIFDIKAIDLKPSNSNNNNSNNSNSNNSSNNNSNNNNNNNSSNNNIDSNSELNRRVYCKVRFDRWGAEYDGWYDEELLLLSSSTATTAVSARSLAAERRDQFRNENVLQPPQLLKTLRAATFMHESDRFCGCSRPPLSFSNCDDAVGLLRAAMLMIEAALPAGAVDDSSEERWGDNFSLAWRYSVSVASDAVHLMQCQLMLEYGVRTAWLKPTGLKALSCMPSRIHLLRNATMGMVAVRVWVLDMTVKYDKVGGVDADAARSRPTKLAEMAPKKGAKRAPEQPAASSSSGRALKLSRRNFEDL